MDDPRMQSLVERILGSAAPVLVSAIDGSGRRQLIRSLARATRTQPTTLGKSGWTAAVETNSPVLAVEASGNATDPALDAELAAALDARFVEGHCIVVARRFGAQVLTSAHRDNLLHITEHDLWYAEAQLQSLVTDRGGDAAAAELVFEMTGGWPALVSDLLTREGAFDSDAGQPLASLLRDLLDIRMNELVDAMPSAHVDTFARLGVLSVFDDQILDLLGTTTIDSLVHSGVPVFAQGRGLHSIPAVIRSWLMLSVPRTQTIPASVFDHLARQGFAIEAVEAAMAARQHDDAAQILSCLSADQSDRIEVDRVAAATSQLASQLRAHPRSRLVEARVYLARGDLTKATSIVEEALVDLDQSAHPDTAAEMRAELALFRYNAGDLHRAQALLPSPEPFALPVARARQLDIEAGIAALHMTPDSLDRASELYEQAIALWHAEDGFSIAATSAARLAVEVRFQQGRFDEAIAALQQAETTAAAQPIRLTNFRLHRARVEATAGHRSTARQTLNECVGAIETLGIGWMRGFRHNVELIGAGQEVNHRRVLDLEVQMRSAFGEMMHLAPGTIALSEIVEAHVRCDAESDAMRCLDELLANANAEPPIQRFAALQVACGYDSPEQALRGCDDYRSSGWHVPHGRWRLDVAQAVALHRSGQHTQAAQALARARAAADELGAPGLVDRVERRACAMASNTTTAGSASQSRCHIQLLARFSVTVDGELATIPEGRQRALLKLLVLDRGAVPIETVLDALWPDADPDASRQRIRNVLARLRKICGPIITRDGDMLRLAPGEASSDYHEWHQAAEAQLETTPSSHELDRLIDSAPNELLDTDRYTDWLQDHQRAYKTLLLRLVDRRIDAALALNDTTQALACYHRALDIDPLANDRIDLAISLARSAGLPDDAATFERRRHEARL